MKNNHPDDLHEIDDAAQELADSVEHVAGRMAGGGERAPRLAGVPPPNRLNLPAWFGVAVGLCAVLFIPWIVYLATQLPSHARAAHYDVMWVGFDVGMWTVLAALALAAIRRSTLTDPLAVSAAVFMIIDAWFDVVSADSRDRLIGALLSACLVELPGAAICLWIASHAARIRERAYKRLFAWALLRAPDGSDR